MTHGYRNIFGGIEDWTDLLTSGNAILEAVATDWIFGTTPVVPPSGGGYWESKRRRRDEEELILIGG